MMERSNWSQKPGQEYVLDDLPAARTEVMREAYSAEFLEELERLHAAAQRSKEADGRDA